MVSWKIILEKGFKFFCLSLQKHKTADSWLFFFYNAFAIWLALISDGTMDKTIRFEIAFKLDGFKCFFKFFCRKMLDKEVSPRCSFFFTMGHSFYFSSRFFIRPNNVDALW